MNTCKQTARELQEWIDEGMGDDFISWAPKVISPTTALTT